MSNPNRITAGSAARLLFFAYDATTLMPYTSLVYSATFSTKLSQQRIGGVWQTGVSLGTILDGTTDGTAVAAGTFVKHVTGDGLNNLYSIDVASSQITNSGGVDAIRLQLVVAGVMFVPVVHTIDAPGIAVDVAKIKNSETAADNLSKSAEAIVRCTVSTGSSPTSITTSACSPAHSASTPNQFVGRPVVFLSDTTTPELRGQGTMITASSASATPTLTVDILTATPVSGDTFEIC